jgi:tryptophanyl-tRNA synthetase
MFTDPQKLRKGDPGRPDICPVYYLHKIYTPDHEDIVEPCKSGELGCVEDKKRLIANVNNALEPVREKRKKLVENPEEVFDILKDGAKRARVRAQAVMAKVRENMNMAYY